MTWKCPTCGKADENVKPLGELLKGEVRTMDAQVVKVVLSDGSEVFDVHCDEAVFHCTCEAAAEMLAEAISAYAI